MNVRAIPAALLLLVASLSTMATLVMGKRAAKVTESVATVRANVEDLIRQSGGEASLAFRSLDGNRELFINAETVFPATSQWVEIPVMVELRAEAQARTLKLDDTLVVKNEFRSAADGSTYQLQPDLDPDATLYKQIGQHVSLADLEGHMMKANSQLATNLLIQMLGLARINGRMAELQSGDIRLQHGFQDLKAEKAGERNQVTSRGMMELLWSLATDRAVSAESSKKMVGLLANSRTATSGPFAAQRTTGHSADNEQAAAIIYGAHSFAFAVVVRGLKSSAESAALISKISRELATTVN